MSTFPIPEDLAANLEMKTVTASDEDTSDPVGGWVMTLNCGHVIWSAIKIAVGSRQYCAACLDDVLRQLKHGPETNER